jgi:hypothetical protein
VGADKTLTHAVRSCSKSAECSGCENTEPVIDLLGRKKALLMTTGGVPLPSHNSPHRDARSSRPCDAQPAPTVTSEVAIGTNHLGHKDSPASYT